MPSTIIKPGEKHGNTSRLFGSQDSATSFSFAFPLSCCLQLLAKTILGCCSRSNKIVKQDKRQQTTSVSYSISITAAEPSGKKYSLIFLLFFFFVSIIGCGRFRIQSSTLFSGIGGTGMYFGWPIIAFYSINCLMYFFQLDNSDVLFLDPFYQLFATAWILRFIFFVSHISILLEVPDIFFSQAFFFII